MESNLKTCCTQKLRVQYTREYEFMWKTKI